MSTTGDVYTFDGGNLALDLLNTRRVRSGRPVDHISPGHRLPEWLAAAGIVRRGAHAGTTSPPELRRLADEARLLRDAVHEAVMAFTAGASLPRHSLHALNRVLDSSRARLELRETADGLALEDIEDGDSVLTTLAPIAVAAAELLTTADARRIRQCDSDRCVIWFLDTSKNGRRRWCSMSRCGNRAKVAKHYRKRLRQPDTG